MSNKYPGLSFVASFYRGIAWVVGIGGFLLTLNASSPDTHPLFVSLGLNTPIGFIVGIVISALIGLSMYAVGDYFTCIMDIESNTTLKKKNISPPPVSQDQDTNPSPLDGDQDYINHPNPFSGYQAQKEAEETRLMKESLGKKQFELAKKELELAKKDLELTNREAKLADELAAEEAIAKTSAKLAAEEARVKAAAKLANERAVEESRRKEEQTAKDLKAGKAKTTVNIKGLLNKKLW